MEDKKRIEQKSKLKQKKQIKKLGEDQRKI